MFKNAPTIFTAKNESTMDLPFEEAGFFLEKKKKEGR